MTKITLIKFLMLSFLTLMNCDSDREEENERIRKDFELNDEDFKTFLRLDLNEKELEMTKLPNFTDLFGVTYNWQNSNEGWYPFRRIMYVHQIRLMEYQMKNVKKYTKIGYKVTDIPGPLYRTIQDQRLDEDIKVEICRTSNHLNCKIQENGVYKKLNNTFMVPFLNGNVLERMLTKYLRPILSEWAGNMKFDKNPTAYGIRRYTRGTSLLMHVDRLPTHVISAILQIDQKVDEDWPLTLIDHNGKKVSLMLKPGQMVLYESATVPHGRQFPLKGEYFDNIFIHFSPEDGKIYT